MVFLKFNKNTGCLKSTKEKMKECELLKEIVKNITSHRIQITGEQ